MSGFSNAEEAFMHYGPDDGDCNNGVPSIFRSMEPLEFAVRDFHERHGATVGNHQKPAIVKAELRYALLKEELEEFREACDAGDLVKAIDGLADLIYVAIGGFVSFGVESGPVLEEVHRSNMTKTPGTGRADGKILKGAGYEPPDIAGAIDAQCDYYALLNETYPDWGDYAGNDALYAGNAAVIGLFASDEDGRDT